MNNETKLHSKAANDLYRKLSIMKNNKDVLVYVMETEEEIIKMKKEFSNWLLHSDKIANNKLYVNSIIKIYFISLENLHEEKIDFENVSNILFECHDLNKIYSEGERNYLYKIPNQFIDFIKNIDKLNSTVQFNFRTRYLVDKKTISSHFGARSFITNKSIPKEYSNENRINICVSLIPLEI